MHLQFSDVINSYIYQNNQKFGCKLLTNIEIMHIFFHNFPSQRCKFFTIGPDFVTTNPVLAPSTSLEKITVTSTDRVERHPRACRSTSDNQHVKLFRCQGLKLLFSGWQGSPCILLFNVTGSANMLEEKKYNKLN